ncbi:hypothetical protein [Ferrimonas sp. SCSIO 43195]|uniref:hypothetical protein n=1 Tax=Ferrimonas sp. SCSIO 43195 TaxID=2822844 RepID=UPI0020762F93|nr:hypothetical protein [Ferrimonas sp. SCSIO 43195]USD35984.1 hypothetical protein J8Z22_13145 [Ferrimonas sp. SCSIO 43195]
MMIPFTHSTQLGDNSWNKYYTSMMAKGLPAIRIIKQSKYKVELQGEYPSVDTEVEERLNKLLCDGLEKDEWYRAGQDGFTLSGVSPEVAEALAVRTFNLLTSGDSAYRRYTANEVASLARPSQ